MGESAVLVHSYSFAAAPINRNESHEDNTLHALSQSISFGKFMTENLEWGKWSSFSHKKYVEEAEKYSRPGSVAQKKAFFEAHYKRIAEAKKAATEEQPTVTPAEVLLHTLETQPPPPPPPANKYHQEEVKDDDDEEGCKRNSFQIDDPVVADDLTDELKENGIIGDDEKEVKKKQEEELLKEDWSVGEKEKQRKSITKNKPVFRLSLEKTIPPKSLEEISLTEKRSERLIAQISEKNEEKPVHRQRFSFLKSESEQENGKDGEEEAVSVSLFEAKDYKRIIIRKSKKLKEHSFENVYTVYKGIMGEHTRLFDQAFSDKSTTISSM